MNALPDLAANLAISFPVTSANCNETPFFDFKINNGAYVEITPFNQAARDMMNGRSFIEEMPWHANIARLIANAEDATFMDGNGEAISAADFKDQLAEMTVAANDL